MMSNCRTGGSAQFLRWTCIATLLSGLLACGSGDSEAPQAVGSDSDNSEPSPVADQQPAPLQCKVDDPAESEIVLLAGQSNANEGLLAAIDKTLTEQGSKHSLGHHHIGGNPITSWIRDDGTFGAAWTPMMTTFDRAIEKATASGTPISALTFVWFQGESDVYPINYPFYESRLRLLIGAVQTHAKNNWQGVPEPAFSIAQPENVSKTFREAMDVIRESVDTVANDTDRVCAFDTKDIRRVDTVHIPNVPWVGSPEQFVVADRALACARLAANRCERDEQGQ